MKLDSLLAAHANRVKQNFDGIKWLQTSGVSGLTQVT